MNIEDAPFNRTPDTSLPKHGGVQHKFTFPNGYGASVIRHLHSYGSDRGLYELAVLGPDGSLNYETPITEDVLGYLSVQDVNDVLDRIEELKP